MDTACGLTELVSRLLPPATPPEVVADAVRRAKAAALARGQNDAAAIAAELQRQLRATQ